MKSPRNDVLAALALGNVSKYPRNYAPEVLQSVPRSMNRKELGIVAEQPFTGVDVWHAYELSWLNAKGKPAVAVLRLTVDACSPNIVESKSLKLYLNSLNQARFASSDELIATLKSDLSEVVGTDIDIEMFDSSDIHSLASTQIAGDCIDDLDIDVDVYTLSPELLEVGKPIVTESLHSHLLKSNCLITDQPDWASVIIEYSGGKIERESLLRYLISFREHNEFHEQCVERIFCDIQTHCSPSSLSVQALYTRRGGIDINPFRTSDPSKQAPLQRINRQ